VNAERWDLRGDLGAFSVTQVLQFLSMSRCTGTLTLRSAGGEEAMFCFVSVKPVCAYCSSEPSPLDDMLMEGWQGGELWTRIVNTVRSGRVDTQALAEALTVRVREVLRRAIGWNEGEFAFSRRELIPETLVEPDFELEGLILDLVRQADEEGRRVR